jgi:putative ABC transport system permease protein
LPNTLVTTNPTGIPLSEIETVRKINGINPNRFLPVALEQSFFSQRQATEFMNNGLNPQQTNGIVFGIDIKKAFHKQPDGSRPMIEVEFQEGTLETALEKLETGGRYCLIPDSFAFRAGLHVGDKIELVVPRDVNNPTWGNTRGSNRGRGNVENSEGFGRGRGNIENGEGFGGGRGNIENGEGFGGGRGNVENDNVNDIERDRIIDSENKRDPFDTNPNNNQRNKEIDLPENQSPSQREANLTSPRSELRGNFGGRIGVGGVGRGGFGGGRGRGGSGGNEEIVVYEVCGVVTIPGWLWMTKLSGVRKRGGRTGAMLISPYEIVKNDFRLNNAGFFWFDRTLDSSGKPTVSDKELEISLQKFADKYPVRGPASNFPTSSGNTSIPSNNEVIRHSMVKVNSREYLTDRVNSRADSVIQAAAKMPLILLAISSIGLMGTIAASVRIRRFELGVLRSLGVTRFGLVRLIMAEALLISIAAIVISLGFGVVAAWCFIGLMHYTSFFGGFVSPLTIPIYWLSIGFSVTLVLCFLAAIGPAIFAGRTEPSKLLRE